MSYDFIHFLHKHIPGAELIVVAPKVTAVVFGGAPNGATVAVGGAIPKVTPPDCFGAEAPAKLKPVFWMGAELVPAAPKLRPVAAVVGAPKFNVIMHIYMV